MFLVANKELFILFSPSCGFFKGVTAFQAAAAAAYMPTLPRPHGKAGGLRDKGFESLGMRQK